ncbi:MAG: class I SAM-dependent methyltransferase [Pelagibacteraceae bacterium TMED124]|mgnify:CR=1 FL=1|nr:MAG: class I SAM-dependent methyltransferase [Pelagibacteraceae bacterium TMED124]|tara:strand:- start:2822 stop:3499 length:678 start_codon:yes stop_codon:yes gene_type:complete
MIKPSDYEERGWDLKTCFLGDSTLGFEIFEKLKKHELVAGESADGTRNLLFSIILSTRPKRVLEIGSHIGSASVVIGTALKSNKYGLAYHLEPQDHYFEALSNVINEADLQDYSIPLQKYSTDPDLNKIIGNEIDLIFLDANHSYSYAVKDLEISTKLLANNGLILIDDVGNPRSGNIDQENKGGVRQALNDFISENDEYTAIFFDYPFWLNPCGLAILSKKPLN